jgi:hypothetical protein
VDPLSDVDDVLADARAAPVELAAPISSRRSSVSSSAAIAAG